MLAKRRAMMLAITCGISWIALYAENPPGAVAEQWQRHYPDVDTTTYLSVAEILVDSAGNSYIAGTSATTGNGYTFVTKKVNSSGLEVWRSSYSSTDIISPRYIGMDRAGEVYVGAQVGDIPGGERAAIWKYDQQGETVWVATYAYPQDSPKVHLTAMQVASSGEVYLNCGIGLYEHSLEYNVLAICSQVGDLRVARVDSVVRKVESIAIGRQGDLYLCGSADKGEIFVSKCDHSGVLQWSRQFLPGGGLVGGATFDVQQSVVDTAGNVCFVGYGFSLAFGSAGSWVFSYDADGGFRWSAEYDADEYGLSQIRLGSDRMYVSSGSTVASYSSDGLLQWSVSPYADSTLVSSIQPVGVAGLLFAGVERNNPARIHVGLYSRLGTKRWDRLIVGAFGGYDSFPTLATDQSGNAYVLMNNQLGMGHHAIVACDTSGNLAWMEPNCYGCVQQPTAMATDGSGNSYVTGWSHNLAHGEDFLTIEYDPSGVAVWAARYNGPADSTDQAHAVATDRQGNVYVTGASLGKGTNLDYATIKYDRLGSQQWIARYNGPGFGDDIPSAIVVDSSGYVYVTGSSVGSGTSVDYATVKYTPNGLLQWVARYNCMANGADQARAIAVDHLGNVYVSGSSDSTGSYADYLTVKYNALGQQQWTARYNGSPGGVDQLQAMAVDSVGNVVVTGWSDGVGTQIDYATVKYNSAGKQEWATRYDDPASSFDYALGIALDSRGNVFVTGSSSGAGTNEDFTTVKYGASGAEQWVAVYDGPAHEGDVATNIALDLQGNVYVAGHSLGLVGSEAAILKYDGNGVQQWVVRYSDGQVPPNEVPVGLALDGDSDVLVSGASGFAGGSIWTTIKYAQEPTVDVRRQHVDEAAAYHLDQNYPNPFNPSTIIKYTIAPDGNGGTKARDVSLTVFDVLGREVKTLVNERKPPGTYEVRFDALGLSSGVYFYRLQAGGFVDTKKLILIH